VTRWVKYQNSDGLSASHYVKYDNKTRMITVDLFLIPNNNDIITAYRENLQVFNVKYKVKSKIIKQFKELTTIDGAFELVLIENLSGQSLTKMLEYLKEELTS
jgi:hypothetical protein